MKEHEWAYCSHCDVMMIRCKTCGNNTCNATYGKLEDGTVCPDCEDAYQKWYAEESPPLPKDRIAQMRKTQEWWESCCMSNKELHYGNQVAYIPAHADSNIEHPDVRFGFIAKSGEVLSSCVFWKLGQILQRDTENLETEEEQLIPNNLLVNVALVSYAIVNGLLDKKEKKR